MRIPPDKPGPKPAWEWKAGALGAEEKEATKKLNELTAGGWEYVGPLAHGLVAFKWVGAKTSVVET